MVTLPIVVGFDDSPAARLGLTWALRRANDRKADILLAHAVKAFPPLSAGHGDYVSPPMEIPDAAGRAVLQAGLKLAADTSPEVKVTEVLIEDSPAHALLSQLAPAEMIVVGTRGRGGFAGLRVGSTSLKVAAHAPCPVVVVRADEPEAAPGPEAGRLVVGVDTSDPGSSDVIGFAFEEASRLGVGLTALHAWHQDYFDLPGKGAPIPRHVLLDEFQGRERDDLAQALSSWQDKYPEIDLRSEVLPLNPAAALVASSAGAELVVVGAHRRSHHRGSLGSVGHAVLQHSHSPVAVVGHQ